MRAASLQDESAALADLLRALELSRSERRQVVDTATARVREIRAGGHTGVMQDFLVEYGLSTREGVALMCLAEALLRVPDAQTIDVLIEDKVAASNWGLHLGQSSSPFVNASTWALLLTGRLLSDPDEGLAGVLRAAVKRLGEPVVRTAVSQAIRELGSQFVLGQNMEEALIRARRLEARGCTYSYDMLGEAARTAADAQRYHLAYAGGITALGAASRARSVRDRPGMSVKLSALHPRYEYPQRDRALSQLVPRLRSLATLAASAGVGLNVDAEEADRLDLSLDIIEATLAEPGLAGWDGFGVVVQAYGKRAPSLIDWLYALAKHHDRRIMIRLVKGAYWDTEIKRAQALGLADFPVYTRKASTDLSFLVCARKLLAMTDRVYPQFATHNAHTMEAVLLLCDQEGVNPDAFEFQRLHGMGEALHEAVRASAGTACRIYAPVGAHEDLLAYLVRRLLENGANSSFVNQLVDDQVPPEQIASDPVTIVESYLKTPRHPRITPPPALFGRDRVNSRGWDLSDPEEVRRLEGERNAFRTVRWSAGPLIDGRKIDPTSCPSGGSALNVTNPADCGDVVGIVRPAQAADIDKALVVATRAQPQWANRSSNDRANCLRTFADLLEARAPEFFALAAREAGKTWPDCVGEVREASDFARFYAAEAERIDTVGEPRGVVACISPWNFPLAIFCGQVLAALAAGNAVIAKPAEQTALIACRAVELMLEAGIPSGVLHLLPGEGSSVGSALTADPRVRAVSFTGSTRTAGIIDRTMAAHLSPTAALIAETGGLNAMLVDSTALPEQAVRDIVASAFQSAGQRCSALRVLYVQEDVASRLLTMLHGAIDELRVGDPWALTTDVGPVIDQAARTRIESHCEAARRAGRLRKQLDAPATGNFVAPALIEVEGITALAEEVFGPVLHVATFAAGEVDQVIDQINDAGYGLTFGLHTRIDARVQHVVDRVRVGNIYVNRNQIGAVVGSQPFGGEGLSGTGPKAGGPLYLQRLRAPRGPTRISQFEGELLSDSELAQAVSTLSPNLRTPPGGPFHTRELPGPTGESNRLGYAPRGVVLCLGPGAELAAKQARLALQAGNAVVAVAPELRAVPADDDATPIDWGGLSQRCRLLQGQISPNALTRISPLAAVACDAGCKQLGKLREALAGRDGPIVALITEPPNSQYAHRYALERHLCVDTTAAGGNASLLAAAV